MQWILVFCSCHKIIQRGIKQNVEIITNDKLHGHMNLQKMLLYWKVTQIKSNKRYGTALHRKQVDWTSYCQTKISKKKSGNIRNPENLSLGCKGYYCPKNAYF